MHRGKVEGWRIEIAQPFLCRNYNVAKLLETEHQKDVEQ